MRKTDKGRTQDAVVGAAVAVALLLVIAAGYVLSDSRHVAVFRHALGQ